MSSCSVGEKAYRIYCKRTAHRSSTELLLVLRIYAFHQWTLYFDCAIRGISHFHRSLPLSLLPTLSSSSYLFFFLNHILYKFFWQLCLTYYAWDKHLH